MRNRFPLVLVFCVIASLFAGAAQNRPKITPEEPKLTVKYGNDYTVTFSRRIPDQQVQESLGDFVKFTSKQLADGRQIFIEFEPKEDENLVDALKMVQSCEKTLKDGWRLTNPRLSVTFDTEKVEVLKKPATPPPPPPPKKETKSDDKSS